MGTSNAYDGPGDGTPLIPTWLEPDEVVPPPEPAEPPSAEPAPEDPVLPPVPAPPVLPPIPPATSAGRFTAARNNLSRFAGSGGRDRSSLGRAMSHYVSTSCGGSRVAAQRMGASRSAGAQLLNFLSTAIGSGARAALRALNLESLAGRSIEQVFLGLADYVCPDGGTVDEGIAREAFIETICHLAENGITDLDALTAEQMQTIFELYATYAIEARLCNDIGTKAITLPADAAKAANVQTQLLDFVRRGVSDSLTKARAAMQDLTPTRVLNFVTQVYEQAFSILQSMGEAEAEAS